MQTPLSIVVFFIFVCFLLSFLGWVLQRHERLKCASEGLCGESFPWEQYVDQLRYQATHDVVTGLPNRAAFSGLLTEMLSKKERVGIVLFDIDNFKVYNDTMGHSFGDMILLHAAQRLSQVCHKDDFVARLGGDEFVLIPVDTSNLVETGQAVLDQFSTPFHVAGREICLSASVGAAIAPEHGSTADELLRRADIAMYQAKQNARGSIRVFHQHMEDSTLARAEMETQLRQALARDEFVLHYQPQIDVKSGKATGAEALLRWRRADGSLCPPNEFIPLLEETGLINEVGEWVIRQACRQILVWRWAGLPPFRVSVNVSPSQLRRPDFGEMVLDIVDKSGIEPQDLCLELTESMLVPTPAIDRVLQSLKQSRIALSIDDFGTGYSSLQYLHTLPISELKIDRTFVSRLVLEAHDNVIVSAIIGIASAFGVETVAEGIETEEHLHILTRLGATRGQGFWFARPMSADDFTKWLGNWAYLWVEPQACPLQE